MSSDCRTSLCAKVAKDPGLPTGYVPSSQWNGIVRCIWIFAVVLQTSTSRDSCNSVIKIADVFEALLLGSLLMKLMFTVWIVIHLFALAVFHKNFQRLEPLYVVSSLLIPLVVTGVLLAVNLVGEYEPFSPNISFSEDIIYSITFSILIFTSLLVIAMATILCYRACRSRSSILSEYDIQHKKVLCEMLPLLLYPILFFLLTIPICVLAVLDIISNWQWGLLTKSMFAICSPIWSFTTALLLISHLCVIRHIRRKLKAVPKVNPQHQAEGSVTVHETTRLCPKSDTYFSAPVEI